MFTTYLPSNQSANKVDWRENDKNWISNSKKQKSNVSLCDCRKLCIRHVYELWSFNGKCKLVSLTNVQRASIFIKCNALSEQIAHHNANYWIMASVYRCRAPTDTHTHTHTVCVCLESPISLSDCCTSFSILLFSQTFYLIPIRKIICDRHTEQAYVFERKCDRCMT